jgi:hypothetical protein
LPFLSGEIDSQTGTEKAARLSMLEDEGRMMLTKEAYTQKKPNDVSAKTLKIERRGSLGAHAGNMFWWWCTCCTYGCSTEQMRQSHLQTTTPIKAC